MLGITGDSATGRSTLTRGIVQLLGQRGVTPISLDDYYRFNRTERLRNNISPLDPAASNIELMTLQLQALREGRTISKPTYDHRSGTLREPETVAATGLVLAYGTCTLATPELARLFDLSIYLEPDEQLRRAWRINRDVQQRGYDPAEVTALLARDTIDALRHLRPQRTHADVVIHFMAPPQDDAQLHQFGVRLWLRHTPCYYNLAPLIVPSAPHLCISPHIIDEDGQRCDQIDVDAALHPDEVQAFQHLLWNEAPDLQHLLLADFGALVGRDGVAHSDTLAFVQVLVAFLLVHTQKE